MTYEKLPNESHFDHKIRLCVAKLNKEVDLDWSEIIEILGLDCSNDHLRKLSYAYKEFVEHGLDKTIESVSDDELLDKLTNKKLELQLERNKLSAEKNEINKWVRELARTENIYEKITESIERLPEIKVPNDITINKGTQFKSAVINIADAHFGREGKIQGLRGETIAEYSVEIFYKRMWTLLEHIKEIVKKEELNFVTVLNLSDSVDGLLRFSQLQFLQLGMVDQTMQFAEFMSQWLNELSEYVQVDYRSVVGNHVEFRPLNSNRGDFKQENMERLIVWYIKERLKKNQNVTVFDAEDIIYFNVLGTDILAVHGQDERNLENSIKDYMMIYQVPVNILMTGHLHHHNNKTIGMSGLQNIEFVQSPAICGIDEYSVKLKKTSNAGSLITVFKSDYGKYCTYDVRLK